jgi:hypothetical protein
MPKEGTPAEELHRIADILDDVTHRPPPHIQPDRFLSGRWHRRDGTVYARVAEPGSPNAGNIHGNHPSRPL